MITFTKMDVKSKQFADLGVGEFFMFEGTHDPSLIKQKLAFPSKDGFNAVYIEKGLLTSVDPDEDVVVVDLNVNYSFREE